MQCQTSPRGSTLEPKFLQRVGSGALEERPPLAVEHSLEACLLVESGSDLVDLRLEGVPAFDEPGELVGERLSPEAHTPEANLAPPQTSGVPKPCAPRRGERSASREGIPLPAGEEDQAAFIDRDLESNRVADSVAGQNGRKTLERCERADRWYTVLYTMWSSNVRKILLKRAPACLHDDVLSVPSQNRPFDGMQLVLAVDQP